ncbi:fasciclin domain-containing protein [Brumimicrobium mesophilum]|uniref:fasciclin domain-containing protein n=1 Tax=Brumimicrobium mesophilum TaxID=392717 RepID=UPI000D1434AB|nr:fasciclin domain-containing protein [Brumimicrobium mesophilum]
MKTKLLNSIKKVSFTLALSLMAVSAFGQTVYGVISGSPDHTTLTAAIDAAGLDATLNDPMGDFTVFAPDNDAFGLLLSELGITSADLLASPDLSDILTYHVLSNSVASSAITNGDIVTPLNTANTLKLTVTSASDVFVNQGQVLAADLTATNGVVHSVDAVLLTNETVVDIAIDNNFMILTQAVIAAELVPTLSNPFAEFTVFAPTDAAFTTYLTNAGITAADLLASSSLSDILLYHVLGMKVLSTDLTNGLVTTVNGADILVDISTGVMINDATVTLADVNADNGVVHAIDKVLIPGTASVDNLELENISVYPNPTTSLITVENFENLDYTIINLNGEIVKSGKLNNNKIEVENLNNGIYYLNIIDGQKLFSSQFIKK